MQGGMPSTSAPGRAGARWGAGAGAGPPAAAPPPPPAWGGRRLRLRPHRPPPCVLLPAPPAAGLGGGGFGKARPTKKGVLKHTPVWVADKGACPCGSGAPFAACCGPLISGASPAPTPEALMRSRFSAYVKGTPEAVAYILATTHPANEAHNGASLLLADVRATLKRIAWQGLTVLDAPAEHAGKLGAGGATLADPAKGVVRFAATYKVTGQAGYRPDGGAAVGVMEETAVFVREEGRWLYLGGEVALNGGVRA